jgi:preprotein translocase subunit SecF
MSTLLFFNQSRLTQFRLVGFICASLLVVVSILGLLINDFNMGLDFSGGQIVSYVTSQSISPQQMQLELSSLFSQNLQIIPAQNGMHWTLKLADMGEQMSNLDWTVSLAQRLNTELIVLDSTYIGSQVGAELIDSGGMALLVAILLMLAYLTWRFEWRLAIGASVAVIHDVLVVLALFAWFGISVDLNVLASVLAVIGYSINYSIVVGDRIRELMKAQPNAEMSTLNDNAIRSTLTRTLITSGTTLLTVACIGLLAGDALHGFAIALFTGVLVGSFSSITVSATLPELLGLKASFYQQQSAIFIDENP